MSKTFQWCQDKTRLDIWDKQVFFVNLFGNKFWYLNDKRHRENGPAFECANGTKVWYLNDKRHRENGPAAEYTGGTKYWWLNGQRHRVNGPAIEWVNGGKTWYLHGEHYTESDYWQVLKEINEHNISLV